MSPKKIASPLSRKAVLVSVNISQWTARKLDKRITDETNKRYAASKDAGRYNKLLIEAQYTADIQKLVSEARGLVYSMTQPWANEGPRILANANYETFTNKFRDLKRNFEIARDKFVKVYPEAIAERKVQLNGAFNAADYPHPREIASKFEMDLRFSPIPDAADFRSDLDADTVDDIRREIAEGADRALNDAMQHTIRQVVETVGHMADKLKGYNGVEGGKKKKEGDSRSFFRDSLVENIRELADLLPAFNLTDDPELARITQRIVKELCVEDAKSLRENKKARAVVAKSADDILKDVKSLLA